MPSAMRNGIAAPISRKAWRIAASATRRAIRSRPWTTGRSLPARCKPAGAPTTSPATATAAWAPGALASLRNTWRPGTPMGEAVDKSLSHLTQSDIAAMVAYLRSVPAIATPELPSPKPTPAPAAHREGVAANVDPRGKAIFEGACASCHGWTGVNPLMPFATLTGGRAINDPAATNVAQIVLSGAQRQIARGSAFMPPFGQTYSDTEIAAVANYVTARFGAKPSAITAEEVAKLREMK